MKINIKYIILFVFIAFLGIGCHETSNDFSIHRDNPNEDVIPDDNDKGEEEHPVDKLRLLDYIVDAGNGRSFKEILEKVNVSSGTDTIVIFLPEGEYDMGTSVETVLTRSNVSIVGAGMDKTVIKNKPENAGFVPTLLINGISNKQGVVYLHGLTLRNDWPFVENGGGQAQALQDKGYKTIMKKVRMLGYQDTYYHNNDALRTYIDSCYIHGVVDFIYGEGNCYINESVIYLEDRGGNVIVAPSSGAQFGFVFNHCVIDGTPSNNNNYTLGRPWRTGAQAVYLNTKMKVVPLSEGWAEMSGNMPLRFAEYNSCDADGHELDYGQRRTNYSGYEYLGKRVLTEEEAAVYTSQKVLGGSDGWNPEDDLKRITAMVPALSLEGNTLSWTFDDKARCFLLYKDGTYYTQTIEHTYTPTVNGVYKVYAANRLGAIDKPSNEIVVSGL